MPENSQEILIASVTPYFLDRGRFWFEENFEKIKQVAKTQIWWKDNALFLEKDLEINLYELMRRITEMGYLKTQALGAPGDFSQRGGILDIFPINYESAFRLEFKGNKIIQIQKLEIKIFASKEKIKKELGRRQAQDLLYNLKPGDFVVHLDHGIGVFGGFAQKPGGEISKIAPDERSHDKFFVINYAKNDRLYVPLDLEEKLSRYLGFEKPIVHRLGGALWLKTKRHAKESALALAKELLSLYAQRASARGFKYPPDSDWQKELEGDFQFLETGDQSRAVAEVKKDMESEKPMDRLICGDVGFGKTEVALRAAFKAAVAGKQVAVLAPTTILASQHFSTFQDRLKKFPIKIALLTRLQSKNEQKKIVKEIGEGQIDILIGTHRLLSRDLVFKNLGLAVIDEEQRFGVRQKEKFKSLRAESLPLGDSQSESFYGVDILSLSATPIPRTMHLALSGLREISLINTPPPGRLPVKTFVAPFNQKIIKEAIEKELARGGQVYYLYNRVETIGLAVLKLKRLVPQAKIAYIHGRLPEKKLIEIMENFNRDSSSSFLKEGRSEFIPINPPLKRGQGGLKKTRIDVLVATTIIENGLDFPNVNTLIAANAIRLGLAQSYQIRGRIGRSHRQAFAYFLYNSKNLTDEARQRLDALKESEALGSGYQIALRDLEIRGAGNILGREQSGPINAVGLNLYMQMLNEAIEELKK